MSSPPPHNIEQFTIEGLFGRVDVQLPISENKLILVGVNGIGKSTIANIFYHFISRQWSQLLDYDFREASISIDGKEISISKKDLRQSPFIENILSNLPHSLSRQVEALADRGILEKFVSERALSRRELNYYGSLLSAPPDELRRLRSFVRRRLEIEDQDLFVHATQNATAMLRELLPYKTLYLPTYRRIEKDLSVVFPGLEDEVRRYESRSLITAKESDHYIELVSFGMKDVEGKIQTILSKLKEDARTRLNSLAGSYLRDVIRGEAHEFDRSLIGGLQEEDISTILARVEERTLNDSDKSRLSNVITNIRDRTGGRLKSNDKYLAHFFSKLVEVTTELKRQDTAIRSLVHFCNSYLDNKEIAYDDVDYTFRIQSNDAAEIELNQLSSGEKQVVSLFAHLLLSDDDTFMIVIDEPELSLSTLWQKRLLPDVIQTGHCSALFAVTHSPFIFDNELRTSAVDLRRYISTTANFSEV